jgi:spermidine synthase
VLAVILMTEIARQPIFAAAAPARLTIVRALLAVPAIAAFLMRRHAVAFPSLLVVLLAATSMVGDQGFRTLETFRSFFGVARISAVDVPGLGDNVMMLSHGTALHGAQAPVGPLGCKPLVYYAEETPIGQVFVTTKAARPAIDVGAVGLGTGTVATYVRRSDRMTFFEIDPLMVAIANSPKYFAYTTECAKTPPRFVIGDARLSLARVPDGAFDILLIDAFSSDAVPAHLMTVEAMRMYLSKIKPEGIVVLHLSNRNLDLMAPAQAGALAAGGHALYQHHAANPNLPFLWESSEDAVILARDEAALAPYAADPRWSRATATVRPWTDNYMNLIGALIARTRERIAGKEAA